MAQTPCWLRQDGGSVLCSACLAIAANKSSAIGLASISTLCVCCNMEPNQQVQAQCVCCKGAMALYSFT